MTGDDASESLDDPKVSPGRKKKPAAQDGDGNEIDPTEAIFPVLQEVEPGRLRVLGTGFWITRYGLFLTAGHVLDELVRANGTLGVAYAPNPVPENKIVLRRILHATRSREVDLAIGGADNYAEKVPDRPLMNRQVKVTTTVPNVDSRLATYAYPENEVLDFSASASIPEIRGDYFVGELLDNVTESEHPFIPYPYLETSIEVRSGASGAPVFDDKGRVVGVNCRGWDFRGTEHEGENLSSIVPFGQVMSAEVEHLRVPPGSWESEQIPAGRRDKPLTLAELATYGHVRFVL